VAVDFSRTSVAIAEHRTVHARPKPGRKGMVLGTMGVDAISVSNARILAVAVVEKPQTQA